jgi:pimeloyl-ACP methyl ester carboxylesterase
MDSVCPLLAFRLQKLQVPGLSDNIGHAPFWEDTARFNAELAGFVRAANKTN